MMIRIAATVLLLMGSIEAAWAVRVIEDVENSVELTLAELQLPASESGSVSFQACARCRTSVHRVTAATRYLIDGRDVTLADFLRAAQELRAIGNADQRTLAGVYFHVTSKEVTRIALHVPKR